MNFSNILDYILTTLSDVGFITFEQIKINFPDSAIEQKDIFNGLLMQKVGNVKIVCFCCNSNSDSIRLSFEIIDSNKIEKNTCKDIYCIYGSKLNIDEILVEESLKLYDSCGFNVCKPPLELIQNPLPNLALNDSDDNKVEKIKNDDSQKKKGQKSILSFFGSTK